MSRRLNRTLRRFGLTPGRLLLTGAVVGSTLSAVGVYQMTRGGGEVTAEGSGSGEGSSEGALTAQQPTPPANGVASGNVVSGPGVIKLDQDAPAETSAPSKEAICPGCDVVLITVCSLRRDYVSAYDEIDPITPWMDRVAEEGFRFDRAYSASNFTLAGLTAVLTGRFGSTTGVTGWDKGLTADVRTLPEILGYYGYATGGFTIDAPSGFRPDYGLHRGFQRMQIIPPPRDTPDGRQPGTDPDLPGGLSAVPAAEWIREQSGDQPIFAMFHTRTAHYPFVITDVGIDEDETGVSRALFDVGRDAAHLGPMPGGAGGTARQGAVQMAGGDPSADAVRAAGDAGVAMWRQRYKESVARTDYDIKAIWDALEDSGRLDRTILVVIADHGESLDDHNELLHGDAYFEGVVRVPFVMRVPGLDGGRAVDALVSQVDLAPTLLSLVGALPPADIDGRSLVPLLTGEADAVRGTALVEGGVTRQTNDIPRGAVISPPWTLLRQDRGCGEAGGPPRKPGEPSTCLFNVDEDPGQTRNYAAEQAEVVDQLLERWYAFREARGGEGRQLKLDPSFVEELHRTGYDFEPADP